jgi:hypothetical protein
MILRHWPTQMNTTINEVEKQQEKNQVHLMYHRRVPQKKQNPKIVVKNREGIPPENLDDGGDKDPTRKTIEKSHIVHTSIKRKREVQKEGQELPEVEVSPKDMEVDDMIEEPNWEEQRMIKSRVIAEELASQEPKIFEEESVTFHHTAYNKNSKKLLIEKVNLKNKKVSEKWKSKIDFHGVKPSKIIQFHEATREALKESIDDIEKENLILKEKVKELEKYFLPRPLFIEPITVIQPLCSLEDVPETSSRLKGSSSLLMVVRKYIGDSIKKR